ncbi:hypothetical protein GV794_02020 [Nocardia cyriacigeorgica]|uniref:Uncharacterized protein n=1 Tax=Nocardia cyriacigeorgica TaxID=135487 RepID=A0ABX0CD05_9NOCA|nr:DUF6221 family protein [Nocardia cyriacigeorgica]NEW42737.1 hypothetical protein [Nocardia cyriacigeorgica]NEW53968.1 hypothetical protein [Nocardia cyriacigeorgica]NEW54443.1 hypothetical protein [Nocardia cyriacigeorgica]
MRIEQFIQRRMAEDAAVARGAHKEGALNGDQWRVWKVQDAEGLFGNGIRVFDIDSPPHGDVRLTRDGETAHIENHDPAHVLRIHAALGTLMRAVLEYEGELDHLTAAVPVDDRSRLDHLPAMRAIASIWSDHPDYQVEWVQ